MLPPAWQEMGHLHRFHTPSLNKEEKISWSTRIRALDLCEDELQRWSVLTWSRLKLQLNCALMWKSGSVIYYLKVERLHTVLWVGSSACISPSSLLLSHQPSPDLPSTHESIFSEVFLLPGSSIFVILSNMSTVLSH